MSLSVSSVRMFVAKNQVSVGNVKREQYNTVESNDLTFQGKVNVAKKMTQASMERAFKNYTPVLKVLAGLGILVHNRNISDRLQPKYTSKEFRDLYNYTKGKGTFNYTMHEKTGLVKTSLIATEENELMSDLIWITDSCHNMELVKKKEPYKCTVIFNKVSELYDAQKMAFDNAIADPEGYKRNGLFWSGEQHTGIGHCFIPETKEAHPWYPKTRLESVGNYLQTAMDLLSTGLNGGKYGYKTSESVPDTVIDAVANSTAYLKAIYYPTARSCGAWEEQTFVYSLTSDTSIINQSMREVLKFMYEPTENKNVLDVRERILASHHGDVFADKAELESLLKAGEQRIIDYPNVETLPNIDYQVSDADRKSLYRQYDVAMSFMPQTETLIKDDVKQDVKAKMMVLDELSYAIVRENGAIRYQGDEYLKLDSHVDKEKFSDDFEAEWFLVSEISKGYGTLVKQLIDYLETKPEDKEAKALMEKALDLQTEYINRSYARITPKRAVKANGYPCPSYKVPEAYEAVSTVDGKIKYVPGAHPLTWAQSSLKSASDLFLENLERSENLHN